jgi:hypothetical protein
LYRRTLCLSRPVVQYAYALLNDCFLDGGCVDQTAINLAGACLHLGVIFVCLTPAGGEKSKYDGEICRENPMHNAGMLSFPAQLPADTPTTRACLKAPSHELHSVLKSAWWTIHFDIPTNDFWNTVNFVVNANSAS